MMKRVPGGRFFIIRVGVSWQTIVPRFTISLHDVKISQPKALRNQSSSSDYETRKRFRPRCNKKSIMHGENLSYAFLKEEIEKQNRKSNFLHFETFRTNINRVPITSKFWSKYDSKVEVPDEKKHQNYVDQIDKSITETPKTKYSEPMVESHKIGWISGPFFKYDARDMELLHHPRTSGDITRIGEKIAADKVTQRPKYTGIPFKLS